MPFNMVLPSFVCCTSNFCFLLLIPGMMYNDRFAFAGLYLIWHLDKIPDHAHG